MNRMIKNIILLAGGVVLALSAMSCDEFPPVKYDDPEPYKVYTDADFPGVTFTSVAGRNTQGCLHQGSGQFFRPVR